MVRRVRRCDPGFGSAFVIEALRPLRSGTRWVVWLSAVDAAVGAVAAVDDDDVGVGGCDGGLRSPGWETGWIVADAERCTVSVWVLAARMPVSVESRRAYLQSFEECSAAVEGLC